MSIMPVCSFLLLTLCDFQYFFFLHKCVQILNSIFFCWLLNKLSLLATLSLLQTSLSFPVLCGPYSVVVTVACLGQQVCINILCSGQSWSMQQHSGKKGEGRNTSLREGQNNIFLLFLLLGFATFLMLMQRGAEYMENYSRQ